MQYVNLGNTGMKVSRLCLGMMTYGSKAWRPWILEEDEARPFLQRALDAGINFFDTADVYSLGASEQVLGNLVRSLGANRDEPGHRHQGLPADERRRERPRPLPQAHPDLDRPLPAGASRWTTWTCTRSIAGTTETPIEETMEALHDVVRAGKARYIGASSMFAWQFTKAQYTARTARLDPLRLHAESLQPDLSRGRA